ADAGFRGVVVHPDLGEEPEILHRSADRLVVRVPASARAPLAGKKISALGYGGLEFLTTIPGHFGGSVIQNAGCYGHELRDSLVTVEAVRTGQVATVSNASCEFAYRDSIFKRDNSAWIASATLELAAGDSAAIAARIEDYKNRRIASQPKNRRSAGSIFKNPAPGVSPKKAWQLIDEAGLRGVSQGGAEISAEHCNFIVNNGSGSAADVLHLIHLIEQRVYDTCGVRLEKEVVLVGF
ncbi:MAG TPA: UDP-N-acetylmuramate dehydrogenase, partial [Turneriella sp.]|nr:UDP-N-acetylmuramate dehydrogenase [Turneriella sp.]